MKLEIKGSENYSAVITRIDNKIPLEGCDNICGTIIQGSHVIISKDVKEGDLGIFFPVETQISDFFLKNNNLYEDKNLNADNTKKGFFNHKGRVRCMRLRGNKSEGFWIPLSTFCNLSKEDIDSFKEGTVFDTIDGITLCKKYVIVKNEQNSPKNKEKQANKSFNRIIDEQFHFHINTTHLKRNLDCLNFDSNITITQKLHGSSFIVSNILCNKKLSLKDKIAQKFGVNVITKDYDNVYASRCVIKNKYINEKVSEGYYGVDVWGVVNEELKPFLEKGMTLYGEVVGYLPDSNRMIQKNYDYGCKEGEHKNFIYRITSTNPDGVVFEWSMSQIQMWCKQKGLNAVPLLYSGTVKNLYVSLHNNYCESLDGINFSTFKPDWFLQMLTDEFLDIKCDKDNFEVYCNHDVWDEGIVLRVDSLDIECYKHKSFNFLENETKALDAGETNIEDNQEEISE